MNWLGRTHGTQFELARHFFTSMFENEMFSREQGLRLAAGVIGLAIPAGMLLLDPRVVDAPPEELRRIAVRDELSLLTFLFAITGVLALLAWHSLFPSRADYQALASLPVKPQQIFGARLLSVAFMAMVVAIALALAPSIVSPHNYGIQGDSYSVLFADMFARALSTSLGCLFFFFTVVAIQGLVINLVPGAWRMRLTPYVQASLLIFFLMAGLCSFIVQAWQQNILQQLAGLGTWAPPVWFASLHNLIMGNRQPVVARMAIRGLVAVGLAFFVAGATYLLALRRYQELLIENQDNIVHTRSWKRNLLDLIFRDPREQAVIGFIWKVFARSRMHRLVLLAHFAAGLAIVVGTILLASTTNMWPGWRHILHLAIFSLPMDISFVMLTGVRFSFLLPVELRANWIFQLTESQGRKQWLSAVEHFLVWFVIFPVHFLAFLVAVFVLGWHIAACMVILQVLVSGCGFELLFNGWQRLPFACSYLPGKSQLASVIAWWVFVLGFLVPMLAKIISLISQMTVGYMVGLGILLALFQRLHNVRRDGWGEIGLVYEDRDDVAPDLGIGDAAYAITRYRESARVQRSHDLFEQSMRNEYFPEP